MHQFERPKVTRYVLYPIYLFIYSLCVEINFLPKYQPMNMISMNFAARQHDKYQMCSGCVGAFPKGYIESARKNHS